MNDQGVFVGLDYHQRSVQVCVVASDGTVLVNRKCPNEALEIAGLLGRFGQVRMVALESCCGAADLADRLQEVTGWVIVLAHPGYVNRMKHNPDKSDFSDARMLAELTRCGFLPRVWLAPRWVRELRSLVRYRHQSVDRRRAEKVRILAILREERIAEPKCSRWTRLWLNWLRTSEDLSANRRWLVERHLDELDHLQLRTKEAERRLHELTREDRLVQELQKEPGIGPVTAWTMRAEIGRFDRFRNGKQLSRFCGLSPRNASSGERVADAGLIHAGNRQLKAVIIQASHCLRRHHPRWRAMGVRLQSQGKPGSVVVAAVANRWLRWLHHRYLGLSQELG